MKIEDLSFIAEIDQENANNVNGGMDDPFANVGVFSSLLMEQQADWADFLGNPELANMLRDINSNSFIEPTVYQW